MMDALIWSTREAEAHLQLIGAAPHGELEHELLYSSEVEVGGSQACRDDHVPRGLGCHERVSIAVTTHPREQSESASGCITHVMEEDCCVHPTATL